ncbi:hypothetical protein H4582DRAFT_2072823 [Lactarius indigo]|nr:hypothetical protein H4582DRAFT_2072823 [Lactarius indigo]
MTGIKSAVDTVVGSVSSLGNKVENSGTSLLDRLGDKTHGPTAESETNDASVIAPDASTIPDTQGRRSLHPSGQDPFRNSDEPAPADKS